MSPLPFARVAVALSASLIFCGLANAQEVALSPAIAVLLPPAREINGTKLQITGAGFTSQSYFPSGFYLSWNAEPSTEDLGNPPVSLLGLFSPDGAPLSAAISEGSSMIFPEVRPEWKSVRAEFNVRNFAFSESATGNRRTHYRTAALPIPALGKDISTHVPKNEFIAPNGSRLRLVRMVRQRTGETSDLMTVWKVTPPAQTPELLLYTRNLQAQYRTSAGENKDFVHGFGGFYNLNIIGERPLADDEISILSSNVPNNTKTVAYDFDIIEYARRWREIGAFERVSFEIPVATLWQAAPLLKKEPRVAPISARNSDFEATWESRGFKFGDILRAQVWLRDVIPSADGQKWTLQKASWRRKNGVLEELENQWQSTLFHADNQRAEATEKVEILELKSVLYESLNHDEVLVHEAPPTTDITLTARRAWTLETAHVLKNMPLPAPDGTLRFARGQFFDGTWDLRQVTWVQSAALRKSRGLETPKLVLTFDRDTKFPVRRDDTDFEIGNAVFYDAKGAIEQGELYFVMGDIAEKGHDEDRVQMIIEAPPPSISSLSARFRVRQRTWSGLSKALILPDVPVRALLKENAQN